VFDSFRKKLRRGRNRFFSGLFFVLGILLLLATFAIVGFQVIFYLYRGEWIALPLMRFVELGPGGLHGWVLQPGSWYGLHRLIVWTLKMPTAFMTFALGYLLIRLADRVKLFSD